MEVASPLPFSATGTKRAFACAAPAPGLPSAMVEDGCDSFQPRMTKRRRFLGDTGESTAAAPPFASPFANQNQNIMFSPNQQLKRSRASSPAAEELNRVVEEQAAVIESLKSEKKELQGTLENLKTQHERTQKENHILRKAVQIQQDRQNHAENELKSAQKYREGAEEQMRKMEQVIVSLRYHLQAQQSAGNDFMGMPPPNVF